MGDDDPVFLPRGLVRILPFPNAIRVTVPLQGCSLPDACATMNRRVTPATVRLIGHTPARLIVRLRRLCPTHLLPLSFVPEVTSP
ncbi:hypothetical protein GCM10009867_11210 [Pedococcus aerophilus]|uniref:Uncharacterized protein n=1 Tax=Pedococcus aerophilus TaxID=436356 RepID=A0ABN3UI93_9MICO